MDAPWYHGNIPRDAAEAHLCDAGLSEGLFLVRDSSLGPGNYALSMVYKGKVRVKPMVYEECVLTFVYEEPKRCRAEVQSYTTKLMYFCM